jgi:pilus assembly protein Flp/PilA
LEGGNTVVLDLFTKLQGRLGELRNEDGATAVEYGLLVALIAVVIIVAVQALGGNLQNIFQNVADAVGG